MICSAMLLNYCFQVQSRKLAQDDGGRKNSRRWRATEITLLLAVNRVALFSFAVFPVALRKPGSF